MPIYSRVAVASDGRVGLAGAASAGSIGTLLSPAYTDKPVSVCMHGPTRHGIAAGAITIGARVGPAATGQYVASGTGAFIALEGATAAGQIIEIAVREFE